MATHLITPDIDFIQLKDHIDYSRSGILSKVIWKNEQCQYSLFCLAAKTEISEHTSTRNATVQVIEGTGTLILKSNKIPLQAGVFIFMEANAPHALESDTNLAFVLTLTNV
jgi:quercetin dioxygenase-like cupin family protein